MLTLHYHRQHKKHLERQQHRYHHTTMVNRPLQPRLPKPPGSSTEGVYSQVSLPVTTPPLLHLRSPSTAPKKRKQWPAQPAPSVPVHVVAPEEPLAPQGHLSKYRVLFNKAMMQKPLAASELHIGNASGKPNLCATVQYTSAGSASIADGCRVFMSEVRAAQPSSPSAPQHLIEIDFCNRQHSCKSRRRCARIQTDPLRAKSRRRQHRTGSR